MKFLILDVYPNDDWRLVKDTAGGYGTGNDFGNSLFSKLINAFVSRMIAMPPMYAIYIDSIIKEKGHEVTYSRNINDIDKIETANEFEKFNQYNLVYKHRSLNNESIIRLKNFGYKKFYSDIRNLFVVFLSFTSFFRK